MRRPREDSVAWGAVVITYRYHRVRRRTLGLSVYPDLSVVVRVPVGTTVEEIRGFVYKKAAWINKAWRSFEQYLPKQPPRRYVSGESHRDLGRQYRLKVELGDADSVKCVGGYLWVTIEGRREPEKIETLLMAWYRNRAKVVFQERLEVLLQKTGRVGIPAPIVKIRQMTSRWGSCSMHGRVTLNPLLITAPKECIDYVVLHELCHLKVRRHGPRFWKFLERLMPDYQERRKKLNSYGL